MAVVDEVRTVAVMERLSEIRKVGVIESGCCGCNRIRKVAVIGSGCCR